MFQFFANIFGYLLELFYNLTSNYGLAIILFTIVIKLIFLPFSIKQQKTMKKSAKIQEKMKIIQFKYKNNPEKMNQEMMNLYKNEKMNPFSGCFTAIIQFLLLFSIFYLVRSPLTFMEKIPAEDISKYVTQIQESGKSVSGAYPEIDIIREYNFLKEKNPEDANIEKINLQMNFLGIDLSKVPQQNLTDFTVYIIPILYILSSFISIRLTTSMQEKSNKKTKETTIDGTTGKELVPEEENNELDAVMQTNKMMSWMMPIMSISVALVAPLGLALYWLVNNILMIVERVVLDKVIKTEEE
ncbi:MAG: YidC/Oxa1 family membrane protein insertase [Clostridia bacterium]|nr:YidC/Oxa1 family membrane protein insertase [Clostridium sp.]MBS6253064.1 YidC/Oxa1 family membrane protein insertase [Clostridium sp.]